MHPSLDPVRWRDTQTTTPLLWEGGTIHEGDRCCTMPKVPFMRDLAALGVAEWGDVTNERGDPLRL